MARIPSLAVLRALEAAVRLQSYSAAARELNVTHGAISHRIRDLEAALGDQLFVRAGNEMRPTPEARRIATHARQAFAHLEACFGGTTLGAAGRLSISAVPAFATRYLAARLPEFIASSASSVRVMARADLDPLTGGQTNVALRYGHGPWHGLTGQSLPQDVMFAVCTPAYAQTQRLTTPQCWAEFDRAEKVGHRWQAWSPWLRKLGRNSNEQELPRVFDDSDLMIRSCIAAGGVALVRGFLALDDLSEGKLVALPLGGVLDQQRFFLLHRTGQQPGGFTAFAEWLGNRMLEDVASLRRVLECGGPIVG